MFKNWLAMGTWVAHLVKRPTSAQVTIQGSWDQPCSGSLLWGKSASPSASRAPPTHARVRSLSLSQLNNQNLKK